jgi:hypothetical protein
MRDALATARPCVAALAAVLIAVLTAAACTHTVEIDSLPSGAMVSIDGQSAGQAPVRYDEVTGWRNSVLIEMRLEGHATVRQRVEQSEWNVPIAFLSVCCSLGLGSPLTGLGALPLTGLFFARQLPDKVVIALPPNEPSGGPSARSKDRMPAVAQLAY